MSPHQVLCVNCVLQPRGLQPLLPYLNETEWNRLENVLLYGTVLVYTYMHKVIKCIS